MQIDWSKTIDDILSRKISCLRCGRLETSVCVGYSRAAAVSDYAPRCQDCSRKDGCDARKLVVLCESCAEELHIRAKQADEEGMMALLINDCRRDLEDCLDYLTDYWQDGLDIETDDEDEEPALESISPDAFAEENAWRTRLEEEYLSYHRWFRERGLHIPEPGWRSEYAEEIIALGYSTLLGD